jgi:hypothetical protein
MFAYHEALRQPDNLKCLSKYASRSTFFLEIFHTMLQWFWTILLSTASWIGIVCFILLLALQCNFIIVEATYIVYWFGECFFFVGSSVVACCCCLVHNSTCASAFHRFGVSFHAIVSFSIPSLLFSVCSLQVRMFAYFYWHARHMFLVPSVLRLQFRNRWRYICCLLVRWLLLVRWFIGSSVVGCVCLAQVYDLGPWGCSWACSFFLAGLVLAIFFCFLQLCRVGVLRR